MLYIAIGFFVIINGWTSWLLTVNVVLGHPMIELFLIKMFYIAIGFYCVIKDNWSLTERRTVPPTFDLFLIRMSDVLFCHTGFF